MALKPRSFLGTIPIGCARRLVDFPGALDEIGIDTFYADMLACVEAEVGRRHDLVDSCVMLRKECMSGVLNFSIVRCHKLQYILKCYQMGKKHHIFPKVDSGMLQRL